MKTCFWSLALVSALAWGQAPPDTEIFVAEITADDDTLSIRKVRNITNRVGYDNQPMFRSSHQLLFTSQRGEGETANTDIFQYDLSTGETTRLTETTESEYSPTPTPEGKGFSVIRVEADGSQRLWRFPWDGGEPSLVLPNIKPVGYHVWLDDARLAMFILGEPHTLQVAAIGGEPKVLMPDVGRCFKKIPGQNAFSVVQRPSNKPWVLKRFDSKTLKSVDLITTKAGAEDYAWTPSGQVLMASGSKLFRWNPRKDSDWVMVTDLEDQKLKQITRLAVCPDGWHVAMVATP